MHYTFRRSVLEPQKTVTVENGEITVVPKEGATLRRKIGDVASIRLAFEPTRVQTGLYTATLHVKNQPYPFLIIHSESYRGIGNFDSHGREFREFMLGLIAAVAQANPQAQFLTGVERAKYVGNIVLLAVSLLLLLWVVLALRDASWPSIAIAHLVVVVPLLPIGLRWIRVNNLKPFDPRSVPPDLLPPKVEEA